jgi:hypothetical protein
LEVHEIRDVSKYCEYEESPGHTKIECLQLKDELERKARLGKLYQFIKKYVNGKGTGRLDERGLKDPRSGNRDPATR